MTDEFNLIFRSETVFNGFGLIKDSKGQQYNGRTIVDLVDEVHDEDIADLKKELRE